MDGRKPEVKPPRRSKKRKEGANAAPKVTTPSPSRSLEAPPHQNDVKIAHKIIFYSPLDLTLPITEASCLLPEESVKIKPEIAQDYVEYARMHGAILMDLIKNYKVIKKEPPRKKPSKPVKPQQLAPTTAASPSNSIVKRPKS